MPPLDNTQEHRTLCAQNVRWYGLEGMYLNLFREDLISQTREDPGFLG